MSSTLHPNYTGMPQLTQNSFELLQHSAAPFAVHVMQIVLSLGQWWDTVRKGWAPTRTVLALPSPLPSFEPQPLQAPEQHQCCKGEVVPCSPFYPLETWSNCLLAGPGARNPLYL